MDPHVLMCMRVFFSFQVTRRMDFLFHTLTGHFG
jgi:hypothetical protein